MWCRLRNKTEKCLSPSPFATREERQVRWFLDEHPVPLIDFWITVLEMMRNRATGVMKCFMGNQKPFLGKKDSEVRSTLSQALCWTWTYNLSVIFTQSVKEREMGAARDPMHMEKPSTDCVLGAMENPCPHNREAPCKAFYLDNHEAGSIVVTILYRRGHCSLFKLMQVDSDWKSQRLVSRWLIQHTSKP